MTAPLSSVGDSGHHQPVWLGLKPEAGNIPAGLKALDQWVLWRAQVKPNGKRSKVPYTAATSRCASSTDATTWSDWDTSWAAYNEAPDAYDGVGFVVTANDELVGVDLDHCVDPASGEPTAEAAAIIERCGTYAEVSPSGTGVRIIGYGKQITAACPDRGVEIYSEGRFLTITGRRLNGADLAPIPEAVLDELAARARGPREQADAQARSSGSKVSASVIHDLRSALASMRSDDRDLWVRMGMALRELADVGRGLWLEWSQMSEKFDPVDAARVWDSLKPDRTGYAAVFAEAQRRGWVNPRISRGPRKLQDSPAQPAPTTPRQAPNAHGPDPDDQDWPPPKAIGAELLPVPAFDAEVLLPQPLRDWVVDEAERMPCAPDYIAAAAVVELGSVIGARCAIRPKSRDNWEVVPNVWGGIVGLPAAKKSPAFSAAKKPLAVLIAQALADYESAKRDYEIDGTILDARKDAVERKIKSAATKGGNLDDHAAELRGLLDEAPPPPVLRRFTSNDVTVERLGELLRDNPQGLLVYRDELVGLISQWDKEGREGDRAFYLEGWNGTSSFDTDRIKRGSIRIENLCVSLFGGIQPDKLTRYLEQAKNALANDGMLQRFQVLVYPDEPRWEWRNRDPNAAARQAVGDLFEALANFVPTDWCAAPAGEGAKLPYFTFDDKAESVFIKWAADLHQVRLPGEDNPLIAQHLAKFDKLFPALALTFHLVDCAATGQRGPVTEASALRAAAWCEYLEAHARRCYGLLADDGLRAAQALAAKLSKGKLTDGFTARDVRRNQWSYLQSPEAVEAALDWLEDDSWIRSEQCRAGAAGGRPTVIYRINPKLLDRGRPRDGNG